MKSNPLSLDRSDLEALKEAFHAVGNPQTVQALRDLFALGCYVHLTGGRKGRIAGSKACHAAIDALHPPRLDLIRKIFDNLTGNEEWLANFFCGHREIIELFFASEEGRSEPAPEYPVPFDGMTDGHCPACRLEGKSLYLRLNRDDFWECPVCRCQLKRVAQGLAVLPFRGKAQLKELSAEGQVADRTRLFGFPAPSGLVEADVVFADESEFRNYLGRIKEQEC